MERPPDRLVAGRYRLLAAVGSGGMGTVWRARDEVLGREVAVKEVRFPPGLSDAERAVLVERTRREARAAARLDHPSAVTVYDVVEQDGAPYLVLELVEARTLADVVEQDGPLDPQRTAQVGLALLGALEAAHRQGIVHRDVKPSNVMVREDGRVVLTDFGIATSTGDSSLTHTGLLLGSPAYIAPERARGQAPAPPSDLWSLGATLFTAVEGRPPYDAGEPILTVTAVVTGEHAPFRRAGPLEPVLDGLLEKDPDRRLDAAQVRELLQPTADRAAQPRTRVLPAPVLTADTGPARTAALDLGEVHDELAGAGAARSAPETAALPPPETAALPPPAQPPRTAPSPPLAVATTGAPVRPAAAPAERRRPSWLAPVAAAAVLLAGAGGAYALSQADDPRATPDAASATSAPTERPARSEEPAGAASSDPAPSPEQEPTQPAAEEPTEQAAPEAAAEEAQGAAGGLPEGWTRDTSRAGWTVALPPGYVRTRAGEYRSAQTGRTLRVESGPGRPDAVADRERAAAGFARRHPSYREIRIEPVDYRGYEAADWEFTYEGLHVLNRVFVVDGTGHSLFLQTRADDVDEARADFDAIAAAFTPVGT